ncbi:MAG: ATP-dependent protease ATPase subunit HslU [Armatimonadetes bacterium]|nr:ATP-dependent protease ATPase subunit HslU [Armatimonadota bacterium]
MPESLTPSQIVAELDRHIVGQAAAKRAVAIALRNRYRRQQLPEDVREEVIPKNILMIGATGVGKTEIARRLAKLARSPFLKIEATKFTEVGYVGRDVESMVRDITDAAVRMVEEEQFARDEPQARERAVERVLDALLKEPGAATADTDVPPHLRWMRDMAASFGQRSGAGMTGAAEAPMPEPSPPPAPDPRRRAEVRRQLLAGELDAEMVEIDVEESRSPVFNIFGGQGEEMIRMEDALGGMMPKQTRHRRATVAEAIKVLTREEAAKLADRDSLVREAISRAENDGIIFIDEMDKIAGRGNTNGPDVSREGVQRDILPVVEGTTVVTKYGPVNTRHMLFIAAGAFHVSKPSDLIPELQGRFPIRVELEALGAGDLKRILCEPEHSLAKQYQLLLGTEGITLEFTDEALDEIGDIATRVNERSENIGARRLHTVLENLLEELSYAAPDIGATRVIVTPEYVHRRLNKIVEDEDQSRYIL